MARIASERAEPGRFRIRLEHVAKTALCARRRPDSNQGCAALGQARRL
jgi:hypothetical protein